MRRGIVLLEAGEAVDKLDGHVIALRNGLRAHKELAAHREESPNCNEVDAPSINRCEE